MAIETKFQDSEELEFLTEPGTYDAKITHIDEGLTTDNKDQITVRVTTREGKSIADVLQFTEKSQWRIDQFIRAVFGAGAPNKGENVVLSADWLVGKKVTIETFLDKYKDKTTNEPRERLKIRRWKAIQADAPQTAALVAPEVPKPAAAPAVSKPW